MTKSKRPYIPLAVRLEAALRQLGLDPATAELDHDPALELRERIEVPEGVIAYGRSTVTDDDGRKFYHIPDANDPKHMVWRGKAEHSVKTNGPGGTKRITSRGGDHGDAAHLRAVTRKEAEFRKRLLAKTEAPDRLAEFGGDVRLAEIALRQDAKDRSDRMGVTSSRSSKPRRKIRSRGFEKRKPRA